jgi:hypothetical protein
VHRAFLGTYRASVPHPHPQRTTLPLRAEHLSDRAPCGHFRPGALATDLLLVLSQA